MVKYKYQIKVTGAKAFPVYKYATQKQFQNLKKISNKFNKGIPKNPIINVLGGYERKIKIVKTGLKRKY